MKFENVDICSWISVNQTFKLFEVVRESTLWTCQNVLPNIPCKCPVEKKRYSADNIITIQGDAEAAIKEITPQAWPNGIYRFIFRFFNDDDPGIATVWFHIEVYDKKGQDRF